MGMVQAHMILYSAAMLRVSTLRATSLWSWVVTGGAANPLASPIAVAILLLCSCLIQAIAGIKRKSEV